MNRSIFERTHLMPNLSKKAIFIMEYEAVVASRVRKAYIRFCLDDEDSFEDEIDECMIRASCFEGITLHLLGFI